MSVLDPINAHGSHFVLTELQAQWVGGPRRQDLEGPQPVGLKRHGLPEFRGF